MSRIYDSSDGRRPVTGETLNDPIRPPLLYSRQDFRDYLEPPALVEAEGLLRQAASALHFHWIGFTVILTFCLVLAVVRTITKPPIYRAQALVEVMGLNQNFLNLRSMDPTNISTEGEGSLETYLRTQVDILQSETLVGRVVDKLHLDQKPEYQEAQPGVAAKFYRVLGAPPAISIPPRERAVDAAQGSLRVQTSKQANSMLTISFSSTDRQLAADFVNELTEQYNEEALQSRARATKRTGEWLQSQLGAVKQNMEASEGALQAANRSLGLMATDNRDSVAEEKLRQIQQELSRVEADRIDKQSLFEMSKANPRNLPTVLEEGPLREYQVKLADLRRQEAEQSVLLAPTSYKIQRLHAQIQELESTLSNERANIISRIRSNYESAVVREKLLRAQYDQQTTKVEELSRKMAGYNTLKHAVDSNRLVYDSMLQKVNDAGIASAVHVTNVRVVDPAKAPSIPAEPNVPLNLGIGLASGLVLGLSWIAVRESTNSRLRKRGNVSQWLRVPELGIVPSIKMLRADRSAKLFDTPSKRAMPSLLADSFRSIVTSILCSGRMARVLTVTSPSPGDGKTTISANLAASLSSIGHSVLLIEGDPRSQRLQQALGGAGLKGLSDLLEHDFPLDEASLESYVQATRIPGVSLLSNGTKPEDIAFLMYSRKVELLLQQLRHKYQTIIFDTPPLLLAPEARVCGRLSDGVVLVVRAERTTREMAVACQNRLAEDGSTLLGTVLNDVDVDPTTHDYYSSVKRSRASRGDLTIAE